MPLVLSLLASFFLFPAWALVTVGNWHVDFDASTSQLSFENAKRRVSLNGPLSFVSEGHAWRIVPARDAVTNRLSLVSAGNGGWPAGTVLGYVSFRALEDRLEMTVFHRAGANFFPGKLAFNASMRLKGDTFTCRTIPARDERVLSFADGMADSLLHDSVFDREGDLAVRFFSSKTRLVTRAKGIYSVSLVADIDQPSAATIALEADGAYYASRWAPGYASVNRHRCPRVPTGWMSWNAYFDKAGSAENLAEARIGAKFLKPFGLEFWSVESWQDNSLWLPVQNFHTLENACYRAQFPEGMKQLADDIRALGFRPGIWMTLYGTGDRAFHDAHRNLFLHDAAGKPIDCWAGQYMLDTTQPESLDLIRRLARQAREEWGYEFFKFDGMANTPRKFERPEIRACAKSPQDALWFENAVRVLREGIGPDAVMLGCMGDFTGSEVKYLDATRLGSDVVSCARGCGDNYHVCGSSPFFQYPVRWNNVLHQAACTFTQVFINNIMAYTDPDTLLVGHALERHEAEVMATIVGLPGQVMFAGDRLGALTYDRMKMIQQLLPVADIRPCNLYPYASSAKLDVWNLNVTRPFGRWNVVALFNWKDEPQCVSVSLRELGLDPARKYTAYEFWWQKWLGVRENGLSVDLPMRSVALIALHEFASHPQFVGDDRHITQGAVELEEMAWRENAHTLSVTVRAIGGFPFVYSFWVPPQYAFVRCEGLGSRVVSSPGDPLVKVAVASPESRAIPLKLVFTTRP